MWHPTQGEKRGRAALSRGHKIIVSPYRKYYLDYSFDVFPLRSCYGFDPHLPGLTEDEQDLIIGVESPLWTEWVDNEERLFWKSFPRATAVAETGWTEQRLRSFKDFIERLKVFMVRLEVIGAPGAQAEFYRYEGRGKMIKLFLSRESVATAEYKKRQPRVVLSDAEPFGIIE